MNVFDSVTEYFKSSRAEFKKVAWPTRQDTIRYSALIVGISVVVAGFFALLDSGLNTTVQTIVSRNRSAQTAPAAPTPVTPTTDVNLNPINVEATTPNGQPADLKVTPTTLPPTTPVK